MRKTASSYFPMNVGQSAEVHAAFRQAEGDFLIAADFVSQDPVDTGQFQRHTEQIRQPTEKALPGLSCQVQRHPVEGGLKLTETGIKIADGAFRWEAGQTVVLPVRVLGARVKKEGLAGVADFRLEDGNPHEKTQGQPGTMWRRGRGGKDHGLPRDIQGEVELGENVHAEKAGTGLLHKTGELFGRQVGVAGRDLKTSVADDQSAWVAKALGASGVNQPGLAIQDSEEVSL